MPPPPRRPLPANAHPNWSGPPAPTASSARGAAPAKRRLPRAGGGGPAGSGLPGHHPAGKGRPPRPPRTRFPRGARGPPAAPPRLSAARAGVNHRSPPHPTAIGHPQGTAEGPPRAAPTNNPAVPRRGGRTPSRRVPRGQDWPGSGHGGGTRGPAREGTPGPEATRDPRGHQPLPGAHAPPREVTGTRARGGDGAAGSGPGALLPDVGGDGGVCERPETPPGPSPTRPPQSGDKTRPPHVHPRRGRRARSGGPGTASPAGGELPGPPSPAAPTRDRPRLRPRRRHCPARPRRHRSGLPPPRDAYAGPGAAARSCGVRGPRPGPARPRAPARHVPSRHVGRGAGPYLRVPPPAECRRPRPAAIRAEGPRRGGRGAGRAGAERRPPPPHVRAAAAAHAGPLPPPPAPGTGAVRPGTYRPTPPGPACPGPRVSGEWGFGPVPADAAAAAAARGLLWSCPARVTPRSSPTAPRGRDTRGAGAACPPAAVGWRTPRNAFMVNRQRSPGATAALRVFTTQFRRVGSPRWQPTPHQGRDAHGLQGRGPVYYFGGREPGAACSGPRAAAGPDAAGIPPVIRFCGRKRAQARRAQRLAAPQRPSREACPRPTQSSSPSRCKTARGTDAPGAPHPPRVPEATQKRSYLQMVFMSCSLPQPNDANCLLGRMSNALICLRAKRSVV